MELLACGPAAELGDELMKEFPLPALLPQRARQKHISTPYKKCHSVYWLFVNKMFFIAGIWFRKGTPQLCYEPR